MLYLKYSCRIWIIIVLFISFVTCSKQEEKLEYGIARFSGKITGNIPSTQKTFFMLNCSNLITGNFYSHKIEIEDDGSFYAEIPMISTTMAAVLYLTAYSGIVCLSPNSETKLKIHFDELGQEHITLENDLGYTTNDMIEGMQNIGKYVVSHNIIGENYKLPPNEYSKAIINEINGFEEIVKRNTSISEAMKPIIFKEMKMYYLNYVLLDYQNCVKAYNEDNASEIKEPEKSYYTFLKEFDLNNKANLSNSMYPIVIQTLLNKEVFNIPPVNEQPIEDWLKHVKKELKDIVGFKDGLFYDIMVSISYGTQLYYEQPLSDIQIQNIRHYYSNTVFENALMTENLKVQKKLESSPEVNKELMDSIISKYKGKVIFVDFWATWCAPCIAAMDKAKIVKERLKDKDVIFMYITTTSSPKELWNKYVADIEGEHYYWEREEWNYFSNKFQFDGIPAYLIYDKEGNLKRKQIGFMGVENMQKWIEELL